GRRGGYIRTMRFMTAWSFPFRNTPSARRRIQKISNDSSCPDWVPCEYLGVAGLASMIRWTVWSCRANLPNWPRVIPIGFWQLSVSMGSWATILPANRVWNRIAKSDETSEDRNTPRAIRSLGLSNMQKRYGWF